MSDVDVTISIGPVASENITQASNGQLLVAGSLMLRGWSIRETSGAAAMACEFSTGQSIVGEATATSGQSANHSLPGTGVYCPQGVTMSGATGAFAGAIFFSLTKP